MEQAFFSLEGINIHEVQKFHNHFLDRGGWCNYTMLTGTGLDSMMAASHRECRRRLDEYPDQYKPKNINFNFINNHALNAIASKEAETYFIGIYSGTFIFLNELFMRIMSSNKLRKHVGDVVKEGSTQKIFTVQHWSLDTYSLAKPGMEPLMPNDYTRRLFAISYTKMALKFLLDHEFAHVILGHVDLANSKGMLGISEKEPSQFSFLDTQTLEMDADSLATHKAILDLHLYNTDKESTKPELREFACDMKNGIANWMFAIYAFYRIFAMADPPYELVARSHPPIGLRLRMIFGSLCRTAMALDPTLLESDLIKIHFDTLIAVEESLTEISESVRGIGEIELSFSEEGIQRINEIVSNYQLLKQKLANYAYAPLAD